ncbi:XdhC family protein [Neobacillus kokaensis]|uniref:Xanthine dehydrogenase accessory factor n=1 Tax=Neobacillus kokaensis TaxID=2759023 RepID=A0ABQ3N766_9BACI|nr:XdhC/CoxI family protein [Neobacillus kokaensis]GHH99327.1 xanthine dehydrogenase accessory factor [Neobacillus kokaensis]
MESIQQITKLLSGMIKNNDTGVLATVVSVQGSAYKREGAKMIIEADGAYHGMISGGCLESDVASSAEYIYRTGKTMVKKYELDEELVWGLGLGCPGTVEILMEPIDSSDLWQRIADIYAKQEAMVVCKILTDEESACLPFVVTKEKVIGSFSDEYLQEHVVTIARQKLNRLTAQSESICFETRTSKEEIVFFDVYLPPPRLFIFGAGHDAVPLARISTIAGFETTVIDPRPAYNTKERFPTAHLLAEDASQVNVDPQTYIVIMNHHLERDAASLAFAIKSNAPYIGVLGPRTRTQRLLRSLKDEGVVFSPKQLTKLFSPIGLDIGAETPEEISVSILSEITAYRTGHQGGFLKNRPFIHKKSQMAVENPS